MVICYDSPIRRKDGNDNSQNMMLNNDNNNNNNNNNVENDALPVEQKGCRRKSRGTKDQLLIDEMVLADCKRKHNNLVME